MTSKLSFDPKEAKKYFENKMAFTTGPVELAHKIKMKDSDIHVVDVRAAEDYAKGHIPGAVNLPAEKWSSPEKFLDKNKINMLYCYSHVCHLAARAATKFADMGYPVMEMDGGYKAWTDHHLEVEP